MKSRNIFLLCAACFPVLLMLGAARAMGVKPETSVVLVDETDGEGTVNVKNTDARPVLLYTELVHIEEDQEDLLAVTPPVARVDAGQSQLVRFILKNKAPLTTERLIRVTFEGIASVDKQSAKEHISVVIRQNLPVIIHPRDLDNDPEPWKRLKFFIEGADLVVHNDSRYVVRVAQQVELLPQQVILQLPHPYVLPGQVIRLKADDRPFSATGVRLFPATSYGFVVSSYETKLERAAGPVAPSASAPANGATADPNTR